MGNISFLVIGTNTISDKFCLAAQECDATIEAIYSRKLDTGRAFSQKYGIKKVYTDLDEALRDTDIDAVYVASPTFLHCRHTVMALLAGKDVLCEKSIASSLSEFEEMILAAEMSGGVLLEAMRPAFDPALEIIKANLSRIGTVRRASLEFCKYSTRYDNFKKGIIENAFDPTIKNSALSDIGVYPLWLAIELFGEPREVKSEKKFLENGFLSMGTSILSYDSHFVSVSYSKITESAAPSFIEGEDGTLFIDKISEPKKLWIKLRDGKEIPLDYHPCENNMRYEIETFAKICKERLDFSKYTATSKAVMKIADMIHYHTAE